MHLSPHQETTRLVACVPLLAAFYVAQAIGQPYETAIQKSRARVGNSLAFLVRTIGYSACSRQLDTHQMAQSRSTNLPSLKIDAQRRRWGRQDQGRYRTVTEDASVGRATIGGVKVECIFRFQQTLLGVLDDKPGGILYIDFKVEQPVDWRLDETVISVILDDKHKAVRKYRTTPPQGETVAMKDYYGPCSIQGTEATAEVIKELRLNPQFQGVGWAISGIDGARNLTKTISSRWKFHGRTFTHRSMRPTKLRWVITESSLEEQSSGPPQIHTAFAFTHNYQPFVLRIKIEGKLRHLHRQFRSKVCGLWSKAIERTEAGTILFPFDENVTYTQGLNEQAQSLRDNMNAIALLHTAIETAWTTQESGSPSSAKATLNPPTTESAQTESTKTMRCVFDALTKPDSQDELLGLDLKELRQTDVPNDNKTTTDDTDSSSVELLYREAAGALQQLSPLVLWLIVVFFNILFWVLS